MGMTYMEPDVTPYRKKRVKKTPKKANHRHTYEPVILSYFNQNKNFSRETGFVGGMDTCPGSRCTICGRVEYGFPKDYEAEPYLWYYKDDLLVKYPGLPVVEVKDIFHPNRD